ncbi:hypothetical protein [Photobacterium toruni]|uniref:Uncharacterized protein n=1 Tax=Photobacterium toruni TaxID=1935446 RepID=A0A1T4USH4_9GAMM|nr:hypothetical protein [Photobacterium toruni]SKA55604.1 hypothetical protein CZ814_03631 [Photobacterium toruni]
MSDVHSLIVPFLLLLLIPKLTVKNKITYYLFGIIGVPIHEMSHYLIARCVGFQIDDAKFIQDPSVNNGCAGYVVYRYKPTLINEVLVVFVGLAPLYIGSVLIYFITQFFGYPIFDNNVNALQFVLDRMSTLDVKWVIYAWLVASITVNMMPSSQDLKTSVRGLLLFSLIISLISYFFKNELMEILAVFAGGLSSCITVGVSVVVPFIAIFSIYNFISSFRKKNPI